jgi:putative transposase
MKQGKVKYPFKTVAIVILPDHIHAIWQLPPVDDNYSLRWQYIKGLFTRRVIAKGVKLNRDKKGEYNLWQRRFWEHTIRDEKDLENHINYIHYNPIKHKLVTNLQDWAFSSFHYYVKNKLLAPDWSSGEDDAEGDKFGE